MPEWVKTMFLNSYRRKNKEEIKILSARWLNHGYKYWR